jgi:putative ABC transport system permease protein
MKKKKETPPALAAWILLKMNSREDRLSVQSDFAEIYEELAAEEGTSKARRWYWIQVLGSIPMFVIDHLYWSATMLKNYLKTGWRNLRKQKTFSIINISGLAVGLACCLLILLYVKNELSYDRFHKNADNIYRVLMNQHWNPWQGKTIWNVTPPGFAPACQNDFPEVVRATRTYNRRTLITVEDRYFNESSFLYVDPEFLKIFSFPLISGDLETALNEPFSVLLTEEMSRKYFGNKNPIGQIININKTYDCRITGVMKDVPENSHLQINFLCSFSSLLSIRGKKWMNGWGSNSPQSYILLQDGSDPHLLQEKFPTFIKKYREEWKETEFLLQPLSRIQLHSTRFHDAVRGDIKHIYFLSAIAIIIMLIACFNYMNLATARATTRIKEVGLRKVVGAERKDIIRQFMGESLSFSLLSLLLAFGLSFFFMPLFNTLIRRNLQFSQLFQGPTPLFIFSLALIIGLISGSYPALYLSSFQPSRILQDKQGTKTRGSARLRSILVVIQFSVSVILIICTFIVGKQLNFLRNTDPGFNKEEILNVYIQDPNLNKSAGTLKNHLLQYPEIEDVLVTQDLPNTISSNSVYTDPPWAGKNGIGTFYINWGWVDYNFLDFFNIELLKGRSFSKDRPTDKEAYIINETAASVIGWEDPIGKQLNKGTVIGLIKDFHYRPLRTEIEPMALSLMEDNEARYFSIKVQSNSLTDTLAFVEAKWKEFSPGYPFVYSFLDERLDQLYRSEKHLLQIFSNFAVLAVLLSCLGLFGLALFTANRKTKEIGIRKVLGASITQILLLLSKEFIRWLILANIFAWPIAYYAMHKWLNAFAYKTTLDALPFALAGAISLGIALMTVSFQSLRSATANPVDSLRYE